MDRKIKIYLEQGQNGVGSIFALLFRAKKEPTPICPKRRKCMEKNKVKISKKVRAIIVIAFIAIYIFAT